MTSNPRADEPGEHDPRVLRDRALVRWWTRDHAGREWTAIERELLGDIAMMLEDVAPRQVDPALCAVTAGGPSTLIALIPHRSLGGLCLVTTIAEQFVSVSWASINDLGTHDDLDLSREVYLYDRHGTSADVAHPAVLGLRAQLARPIVLRMRSTRHGIPLSAACYLRNADGRFRRIARLAPRAGWLRRLRWTVRTDRPISFVDVSPPPYAVPSHASAWFRFDARVPPPAPPGFLSGKPSTPRRPDRLPGDDGEW